ncbi:MAG: hypothetical protein B1H08_06650 [Candidatus Omnitrophica bacterium 4484_171]|nr:MAG: hypothetical protein B1H08_06650 [Candidatus Omnitrophica bacterium 4484_171]
MIPKEILKQIRRIQITTSRMVTDVFAGQYQSVFKGRGMDFDEVRQYFPGDDIRSIDWNVTARTGTPYVKKFVEERELTVMLLLDISRSTYFGTVNKLKRRLAAEICSLLAFSAIQNNDRVGLIAFSGRIEKFVPPRKGIRHGLRIVREALYFEPAGDGTDISNALEYLNRVCRRRTVSFVISDFYDRGFKKALSIANKRHDITAITITDPKEINLPKAGLISFRDAERGNNFIIDTSNEALRKAFHYNAARIMSERKKIFGSINVNSIDIRTDISYIRALISFFKMRERRMRR